MIVLVFVSNRWLIYLLYTFDNNIPRNIIHGLVKMLPIKTNATHLIVSWYVSFQIPSKLSECRSPSVMLVPGCDFFTIWNNKHSPNLHIRALVILTAMQCRTQRSILIFLMHTNILDAWGKFTQKTLLTKVSINTLFTFLREKIGMVYCRKQWQNVNII